MISSQIHPHFPPYFTLASSFQPCTYIDTRTHAHTEIHRHTHRLAHAHRHTRTHIYSHTQIHTYTHTYKHTHILTHTRTHTHTLTHTTLCTCRSSRRPSSDSRQRSSKPRLFASWLRLTHTTPSTLPPCLLCKRALQVDHCL